MRSLRRKRNDFRVVLHEEPKFVNRTFILVEPGVKEGRDRKLKEDYLNV